MPLERADDPGGQGLVEAERIADRKDGLTDLRSSEVPIVIGGGRVSGRVHPDHCEIVVGSGPDDPRAQHLARCEPDCELVRAFNHMIIGDDVAGLVPNEARTGLGGRAFGLGRRRLEPACAPDHLHHGRRYALEQFDGGAFEVGQIPARLYGPRRRGRIEEPVEIRLRDIDAKHDQKRERRNLLKRWSIAHAPVAQQARLTEPVAPSSRHAAMPRFAYSSSSRCTMALGYDNHIRIRLCLQTGASRSLYAARAPVAGSQPLSVTSFASMEGASGNRSARAMRSDDPRCCLFHCASVRRTCSRTLGCSGKLSQGGFSVDDLLTAGGVEPRQDGDEIFVLRNNEVEQGWRGGGEHSSEARRPRPMSRS